MPADDDNDTREPGVWSARDFGPTAGMVAVAIWLTALLGTGDCSQRLSNAGQAVGFVAAAAAIYALVIAVRQLSVQQHSIQQQVEQRHSDEERAHMDRLGDAYIAWFNKATPVLTLMINELTLVWERGGPSEARQALNHTHDRERELRIAATSILMLERRPEFRERVEKTFTSLPSWTGPVPSDQVPKFRDHVSLVAALVRERQDDVRRIFFDVARAVRGS